MPSSSRHARATKRAWANFWGRLEENIFLDALSEFLFIFIVSNLPFLFAILAKLISSDDAEVSWAAVVKIISEIVKPGEILFYVAALLAPFGFVLVRYHRARRVFRFFGFAIVMLLAIYGGCTVLLVVYRLHEGKNQALIGQASLYFYTCSVFLWYLALVFQRILDKHTAKPSTGVNDILNALPK